MFGCGTNSLNNLNKDFNPFNHPCYIIIEVLNYPLNPSFTADQSSFKSAELFKAPLGPLFESRQEINGERERDGERNATKVPIQN